VYMYVLKASSTLAIVGPDAGWPLTALQGPRKLRPPRGAEAPRRGAGETRGNGTETTRPPANDDEGARGHGQPWAS